MSKDLRELLKQLPGWEAAPTSRHIRLVHAETGAVVIVASTPSDHRAKQNTLSACKREMRKLGGYHVTR